MFAWYIFLSRIFPGQEAIARIGDALALAAVLLASILAILLVFRAHLRTPLAMSGLLFTALVFALTNSEYWTDVNGYARVLSPFLVLVALPSIARQTRGVFPWWLGLVPLAIVNLRLGLQFTSAIGGIVRGLLHV